MFNTRMEQLFGIKAVSESKLNYNIGAEYSRHK